MSSLLEATCSLMQVFDGKLQEFTNEINNVHMVWLEEIQQEAQRMFSSDFSTEPELMPKTPSQKRTTRRKRVSMELTEARSKRRFSKGKRSNLRRSSIQSTLNSISELVTTHGSSDGSETLPEEPGPRTRRNKAAALESEPVRRTTRTRGGAKAKERSEVAEEPPAAAPQPPAPSQNVVEGKAEMEHHEEEESDSSSSQARPVMSQAVVEIPKAERASAEMLLQLGSSPGRSANKIGIAAPAAQPSLRPPSTRHSLVLRRSLVGLRHSMTQEAVRRASRRSFLKKKARLGNSTCSSTISGDVSMDVEMEENEVVEGMEQVADAEVAAEPAAEPSTGAHTPQPEELETEMPVEEEAPVQEVEEKPESPSLTENYRFTRSMARPSVSDDSGKKSQDDFCASRSGSKRRAAVMAAEALGTPKKRVSPPKKCMTGITPGMRSFLHTVQKNQLLMMTPSSLGRSSVMKSFIKQPGKLDLKLSIVSVERERQKWDALNNKLEQENERKKRVEEEKRKKQEDIKRKRDERMRRVVEARVKGEKEKEQEKKKKIEEKMAQLEKKNDMLRVERLAEEKAKKKVATKRQEELELRRKQEEAARKKKLQQAEEEERRYQEMLAKRRAEEERERARKQAEAARALELRKEQEQERERERQRQEKEQERQAAAERERVEREKAIALQKELERAAKEKERKELEEKMRREEERKRAEERAAQQKRAAAAAAANAMLPTVTSTLLKMPTSKTLNATITHSPMLNVTVDIEQSVTKTPVNKGTAHNMTVDKGTGLNVTVDVERSPQSYQITPKGKKVEVLVNPEDYGMDQNSDDSTDDESAPRKPIPSWAEGMQLQQAIKDAYFDPIDLHAFFGEVEQPKLEAIFQRSKPRFFKRTSSAVWHSPPQKGAMQN